MQILNIVRNDILEALRDHWKDCEGCPLHKGRTNFVFGEGDPEAKVMFVGEAPGATEDEQGRPFVGRAGKLLDEMIKSIGLQRRNVYIANICKCRPPSNRKPAPQEMKACMPYLNCQIAVIRPKVIVAMGATAVEGLLGPGVGITQRHGKWEVYEVVLRRGSEDIYAMPTFHPAALLRNPAWKEWAAEDMQKVKELIRG